MATTGPSASSGHEGGGGSSANTSRAAPASRPSRRASTSARSSTIPPRDVFTSRAPSLHERQLPLADQPLGLGVRGRWIVRKSAWTSTASRLGMSSTPELPAALLRHVRVEGHDAHAERRGRAGRPWRRPGPGRSPRGSSRGARRPGTAPAPSGRPSSAASAWGMFRAWASSRAPGVLGGRDDVRLRGVHDHDRRAGWRPRRRRCRARSRPGPRPSGSSPRSRTSAVTFVWDRTMRAVVRADGLGQRPRRRARGARPPRTRRGAASRPDSASGSVTRTLMPSTRRLAAS